ALGARARLPGVPRARREGPARAHAIRHAPPVPAVGDLARRDRALDLQLQRCQGGPPGLVHGPRTVLARQLSLRAHALRTDHDGGDPDEPDGRLREWRERIRLERRRIRRERGRRGWWRGRRDVLVPSHRANKAAAFLVYALTAAGDRDGRIGLASLELEESGVARVTERVREDRGTLWPAPA